MITHAAANENRVENASVRARFCSRSGTKTNPKSSENEMENVTTPLQFRSDSVRFPLRCRAKTVALLTLARAKIDGLFARRRIVLHPF